jgi:hypothetical protein
VPGLAALAGAAQGARIDSLSCPSAGDCTAAGEIGVSGNAGNGTCQGAFAARVRAEPEVTQGAVFGGSSSDGRW